MNKYFNRTSGLIVVGTLVVVTFIVGILYSGESEKYAYDRVRIEQDVHYNGYIFDGHNYVLTTKTYIDGECQSKVIDFGTAKEIDSLKCIRYKESNTIGLYLIHLNKKKCK